MYTALDIGGTTIRIAATHDITSPSTFQVRKIPATNNYEKDLDSIVKAVRELAGEEVINGIGCGFPGTFSEDKKTILVAPNLSNWNNKRFVEDLEDTFDCKVFMENDDAISALGEAVYGYGKGKDFVYVTWGTGFGAADVKPQNGQITIKQFEAGHQIIVWENGRQCGCGQTGCAEAYSGGGNIEKNYKKKVSELNAEQWEEILNHVANALVNVIAFYSTQLIIIGGGVAINNKEKQKKIESNIRDRIRIYPAPEVHITELGDDLGLIGAFALLKILQ